MESRPFALTLYANDRVIERFLPVNIETQASGGRYRTAVASFKPGLASLYSKIRLASELKLKFSIDETKLSFDQPFTLSERTKGKLEGYYLDVELPSDLIAKRQEREKFEGTQVHNTLETVISEEAEQKKETGRSELLENAAAKLGQNLQEDDSAAVNNSFNEQLRKRRQATEGKPATIRDRPVICMCVHGPCAPGKASCDPNQPCEAGWKGTLCDVPVVTNERAKSNKSSKSSDPKMRAKVIDDDEEDDIFSVRRISDDDYTEDQTSFSKNVQGFGHVVTATDSDDSESWHPQRAVDNAMQSTSAQNSQTALTQQGKQGWISWIFWSIVTLLKWVLYLIGALFALFVLKWCYDSVMDKIAREKNKRTGRGKRKRRADMEGDGLGFAGGVRYSDSEDEDAEKPIEMTAFNRKQKAPRKRGDSGTDYNQLTPTRDNELQLFDNEEPSSAPSVDSQPQEKGKSSRRAKKEETKQEESQWNPFDAEAQQPNAGFQEQEEGPPSQQQQQQWSQPAQANNSDAAFQQDL
jgi:hypothetical protein